MKRQRMRVGLAGATLLVPGLLLGCSQTMGPPNRQATATPRAPAMLLPPGGQLVRIAFVNRQLGLLAYDGAIRRTTDSGRTWVSVYSTAAPVRQLQWAGADTAFALTGRGIIRSQDAGLRWEVIGDGSSLVRIDLLDGESGHAVGGNRLLATKDGGATFSTIDTGLSVQAVYFITPDHGWVAAPDGIAVTSDGGQSWQRQATFGSIHARFGSFAPGEDQRFADPAWVSIHFTDALHGFVLYAVPTTLMAQRPSFLFSTADGGRHWRLQSAEPYFPLPTPVPTSGGGAMPGWVVGDLVSIGPASALILDYTHVTPSHPSLAITTDAGLSWREYPLPEGSGMYLRDGQIAAVGAQIWVAWLGWDETGPAIGEVRLATTKDLGQTWTILPL